MCPSLASEVPPSPPQWSPKESHRTPVQGSWSKGTTFGPGMDLSLNLNGFGCAKVTPGPLKQNTVMVEWTPAEHLAEDTGIAHEMLKTLKTKKTMSEKILHVLS